MLTWEKDHKQQRRVLKVLVLNLIFVFARLCRLFELQRVLRILSEATRGLDYTAAGLYSEGASNSGEDGNDELNDGFPGSFFHCV